MYNSYGTFYHNGYSELYHHGVKGQSWGKRRYQNPDGSLTPEGYIHYGRKQRRLEKSINAKKDASNFINRSGNASFQATKAIAPVAAALTTAGGTMSGVSAGYSIVESVLPALAGGAALGAYGVGVGALSLAGSKIVKALIDRRTKTLETNLKEIKTKTSKKSYKRRTTV